MSADYLHGRQDGLREAIEIVRSLEDEVVRRLLRPSERRTREARKVRGKAYDVAAKRITTVLRRSARKRPTGRENINSTLSRLGL